MAHWIIDANNVFGSRPDGWWNDRAGAQRRFAQAVAEWSRTHDGTVVLVFDAPLSPSASQLAGGDLSIRESPYRGRNAADRLIVELAVTSVEADLDRAVIVVTSDVGLRRLLPESCAVIGAGAFRDRIGY